MYTPLAEFLRYLLLDTTVKSLFADDEIETNSKIHRQFRNAHEGHRSHAGLDPTRASTGVVVSKHPFKISTLPKNQDYNNFTLYLADLQPSGAQKEPTNMALQRTQMIGQT